MENKYLTSKVYNFIHRLTQINTDDLVVFLPICAHLWIKLTYNLQPTTYNEQQKFFPLLNSLTYQLLNLYLLFVPICVHLWIKLTYNLQPTTNNKNFPHS